MSVKITKNPETGVIVEKNPTLGKDGKQYGFIRVEEATFNFGSVVASTKSKSALKTVVYDDAIKALASGHISEGMELPGRIVTIESLVQELGMKPKQAGKDGGYCQKGGKTIYFKTEYTEDPELVNVLIKHDNISTPVTSDLTAKAKLNA